MVFGSDPKEGIINWGGSRKVTKVPRRRGHLPEEAAWRYVLRASCRWLVWPHGRLDFYNGEFLKNFGWQVNIIFALKEGHFGSRFSKPHYIWWVHMWQGCVFPKTILTVYAIPYALSTKTLILLWDGICLLHLKQGRHFLTFQPVELSGNEAVWTFQG